ncbi:hypothetical protein BGZ70_001204, partial [Mortierella alpina]
VAAHDVKKAALRQGQQLSREDRLQESVAGHHRRYHTTTPVAVYHAGLKTQLHFRRRAEADMNFICLCEKRFVGSRTFVAHFKKHCGNELPVLPTGASCTERVEAETEWMPDNIADEDGQERGTLIAAQDAPHSTPSVTETLQQIQEQHQQDREKVRKAVLAMEKRTRRDQEMNREVLGDMEARIRLSIALSDRDGHGNRSDDRPIEQHDQGAEPHRQLDEAQQPQEQQKRHDEQKQPPQQDQGESRKLQQTLGSQTPREDLYCQGPAPDEGRHWLTISQKLLTIQDKLASADIGHDLQTHIIDSIIEQVDGFIRVAQLAKRSHSRPEHDDRQEATPCVSAVKKARHTDSI